MKIETLINQETEAALNELYNLIAEKNQILILNIRKDQEDDITQALFLFRKY